MTLQYSAAVRNAKLDAVETAIGASAILKIRSGAVPANCAAADAGTVLATKGKEVELPAGSLPPSDVTVPIGVASPAVVPQHRGATRET